MHFVSNLSKPDTADLKLHFARHVRLELGRLMLQYKIQRFDSGRRVAEFAPLGQNALKFEPIDLAAIQAIFQAVCSCWALRASSRSTCFIMMEGAVSALSVLITRLRSTASLNLKLCSSSRRVSRSHSIFMQA